MSDDYEGSEAAREERAWDHVARLRADVARVTAQRDRLRRAIDAASNHLTDAWGDMHDPGCAVQASTICTCGLDDALGGAP